MEKPVTIRLRFGHTEQSHTGVANGKPATAAQFTIRAMNIGQPWRTPGLELVRYGVRVPRAFATHILQRELPDYVKDCIKFPGGTPLEERLRRHGWPTAEQALAEPELRALVLPWFAHDILLEWLGDGEPDCSPGFVINSVEECGLEGDHV